MLSLSRSEGELHPVVEHRGELVFPARLGRTARLLSPAPGAAEAEDASVSLRPSQGLAPGRAAVHRGLAKCALVKCWRSGGSVFVSV